jgi:SAM-dependent methyltransferase
VLHHLQLPQAFQEGHRVLRPGGRMLFLEPLATNPVIELYRRLTPADRSPDETPLTQVHVEQLKSIFRQVSLEFFGFFTLMGLPLARWPRLQGVFMRGARSVDKMFFRLPGAWRLAWVVVIKAEK